MLSPWRKPKWPEKPKKTEGELQFERLSPTKRADYSNEWRDTPSSHKNKRKEEEISRYDGLDIMDYYPRPFYNDTSDNNYSDLSSGNQEASFDGGFGGGDYSGGGAGGSWDDNSGSGSDWSDSGSSWND